MEKELASRGKLWHNSRCIVILFYGSRNGAKLQEKCGANFMDRYRSGHNGTDSKSVDGQPSVGSNPTLSAKNPRKR